MTKRSFKTETIVLEGGERFPLLVHRSNGLPDTFATDYSLVYHRGKPIATTKRAIKAVAMFYDWARNLEIDLDERFGTVRLFSSPENTSLAEVLWQDRRPVRDKGSIRSVVGASQAARVDNIIEYIVWRVGLIVSVLNNNDPRISAGNARLQATTKQLRKLRGKSVSIPRGRLSEQQCERLFEIVRPGAPDNPFQQRTQLRNYLIILAYYELGIRRAEVLTLKGTHATIGPRSTFHITFTPNDREDPRKDLPSIKTKSRLLPISRTLATAYDRYLKERRSNSATAKAAKKTSFVILSVRDGKPLSISSVDDIFVLLRRRFSDVFPRDFAAHHLRRTWNYRFSKAIEKSGVDKELAGKIRKYLMGWSASSIQAANYNQAYIEEQAFKLLMAMQDGITGGSA